MKRALCWASVLAGLFLAPAVAAPPATGDERLDYFRNAWNVIGLKDYDRGTRITPDNRLQVADGEVTLRYGRQANAVGRASTKLLQDGWLPVVLLEAGEGAIRYQFTLWAAPLPTVKDWRLAFDGPCEGENFVNWVLVKATNSGSTPAEGKFGLSVRRSSGDAERAEAFSLPPGASKTAAFAIPFAPAQGEAAWAKEPAEVWLDRTLEFWRGLVLAGARIEVPCRKTTEALRAAHVCQLIANDHGVLHGGEGFYDEFYIRDGGYQAMELEEAGLGEAARRAVDHYLTCQRPDGRFESQKDQFDANGQAVWTLWQFYRITRDAAWLGRVYPAMRRASDWAAKARREAAADSPFAGLLPAAPADGEFLWDGKHHIVGYDLWNLRGMLCTAEAARALGKAGEAVALEAEARSYRAAIDAAHRRTGVPHFPPSWENQGTHWGNTETLWPTELFALDDPRVVATIDHARHVHGGGFIEGTIQWLGTPAAIHPYLSAYTTMASLARGEDAQVVEDYYWYLLHSTAAHAFPEGVFPKRRFAWSHTIPHVTGASNFAVLLRHMLIHERGDELHLLAAVPDGWLAPGREIRVENAPTHFGTMSLRTQGTAAGVQIAIELPRRNAPQRIVLHVPRSRPVQGAPEGVQLAVRPDQPKIWDYPTVVALYRQQAATALRPLERFVALPLDHDLAPQQCVTLDLAAVANTNPFTAPFGVEQTGRLRFHGLPTGRKVAAGIPFEILDPAKNQGKGLVVLDSSRAPQDRAWPREVAIPVGQRGKRLFFLGNVHGWAPNDEGTGELGAVAQYEIVYAGGKRQIVPLITGRTIDEWTADPQADEAVPALRGDPWHLNVIGVSLEDAVVEKILFRDLGTPAAPVLVAVTLEK